MQLFLNKWVTYNPERRGDNLFHCVWRRGDRTPKPMSDPLRQVALRVILSLYKQLMSVTAAFLHFLNQTPPPSLRSETSQAGEKKKKKHMLMLDWAALVDGEIIVYLQRLWGVLWGGSWRRTVIGFHGSMLMQIMCNLNFALTVMLINLPICFFLSRFMRVSLRKKYTYQRVLRLYPGLCVMWINHHHRFIYRTNETKYFTRVFKTE